MKIRSLAVTLLMVAGCFCPSGPSHNTTSGALSETSTTGPASATSGSSSPPTTTAPPPPTTHVDTTSGVDVDVSLSQPTTSSAATTSDDTTSSTGPVVMSSSTAEIEDSTSSTGAGETLAVFLTSQSWPGNALAGGAADELCNTAADANPDIAGLTFVAWLSADGDNVADALIGSTLPYLRLDGVEVAADAAGLMSGHLLAPIAVTETLETIEMSMPCASGTQGVWTGSDAAGLATADTCSGWTDPAAMGLAGSYNATTDAWTACAPRSCATSLRLYCIEVTT